jgi:hypothetical protein
MCSSVLRLSKTLALSDGAEDFVFGRDIAMPEVAVAAGSIQWHMPSSLLAIV